MKKTKTAVKPKVVECISNTGAEEAFKVGEVYEVTCIIGRFYYFGACPHNGYHNSMFREVA